MIKGVYKPSVVFDLDGVLADFVPAFTRVAVEVGQADEVTTGDDHPNWNFPFHVDPVWEQVDRMYAFWENLAPLTTEEDMEYIHALAEEAHILYVTGRRGDLASTANQTHRWLKDNDFPSGPVFFAPPKSDKVEIILPNAEQLIGVLDDKPSVLEVLGAAGVPVVARDWPYNRHVSVPRVPSVAEFVKRLGVEITHTHSLFPGRNPWEVDWSEGGDAE